ncbi:DMT family transporter [Paenibacillus elgii]|nr:DMT family transporter [Paenibacillus elgii]
MSQRRSVALVLTGAVCYGILAAFIKIGYSHGLDPRTISGAQFVVGTILLWGVAIWKRRQIRKPSLAAMFKLMALGTLMGVTGSLYTACMQIVPVSVAVVLLFQFVWIGVLYEWLFQRVIPDRRSLLSVSVSMIGAICAAGVLDGQLAQLSPLGIVLGIGSAFSHAGTLYASGKVATEVNPWLRGPLMATGALLLVLLLFPPVFVVTEVTWNGFWPLALAIGLLGMFVPTLCFMFGAPRISTGLATLLGSVQLPVSVLLAWLAFAEPISVLQSIGVGFILAGIAVAQWKRESGVHEHF